MTTTVPVVQLRMFLVDLFRSAGASEDDVQAGAQVFLVQEMRGVQTHALRRLAGMLDGIATRKINRRPNRIILKEDRAAVVIDGDSGLGLTSAQRGMEEAMRLGRAHGLGMAIVVNSNHFLAAAPYCIQAAEKGFVGIALASVPASMAYPGTNVGAIGIAPVGFAAPAEDYPIVFDAALTTSGGKLTQWERAGTAISEDLAGYDAKGNYTTDPAAIANGGARLPIGFHKGAGLAILVDVLTGVLGGQSFLRTLIPPKRREWGKRGRTTHCFLAIDAEAFSPVPLFKERMTAYVADLKAKPLAAGYEEILVPGERAARSIERCMSEGIPLEDDVARRLLDLARKYRVEAPFAAAP